MRTKAEFEEYVFQKAAIAQKQRNKNVKKQVISFSGAAVAAAVCMFLGFNMFSTDDVPTNTPSSYTVESTDNMENAVDLGTMSDTALTNSYESVDKFGFYDEFFVSSQQSDSSVESRKKPLNVGESSSSHSSTTTANHNSMANGDSTINSDNDRNNDTSKNSSDNSSKNSQASSSRPSSTSSSNSSSSSNSNSNSTSSLTTSSNSSSQSSDSSSSNPSKPNSQPPSTDTDTVISTSSMTSSLYSDVEIDPPPTQSVADGSDICDNPEPSTELDWDNTACDTEDELYVYYGMTFKNEDIDTITVSVLDSSGDTNTEVYYDWYRIQTVCDELNKLVRYNSLDGIDVSLAEESYKTIKVEFYCGEEIIWYVNGDYYHDESWQNIFVPKTD